MSEIKSWRDIMAHNDVYVVPAGDAETQADYDTFYDLDR